MKHKILGREGIRMGWRCERENASSAKDVEECGENLVSWNENITLLKYIQIFHVTILNSPLALSHSHSLAVQPHKPQSCTFWITPRQAEHTLTEVGAYGTYL
jgi:hypothetical protein